MASRSAGRRASGREGGGPSADSAAVAHPVTAVDASPKWGWPPHAPNLYCTDAGKQARLEEIARRRDAVSLRGRVRTKRANKQATARSMLGAVVLRAARWPWGHQHNGQPL